MYKIALLLPLALQLKFIHNFRPFIIVLELGNLYLHLRAH